MLDLIAKYEGIVSTFNVYMYEREGLLLRFKAELILIDNSKVFIKEFIFENRERKYAYHWEDALGNCICRWDNARHWPSISTFPHHKHIEDEVFESTEISIEDVLKSVWSKLKPETDTG
jgi:hypothetical protein